jgi:hypothetical protein
LNVFIDQHSTELYKGGVIDLEAAKSAATTPADFERNLQLIQNLREHSDTLGKNCWGEPNVAPGLTAPAL